MARLIQWLTDNTYVREWAPGVVGETRDAFVGIVDEGISGTGGRHIITTRYRTEAGFRLCVDSIFAGLRELKYNASDLADICEAVRLRISECERPTIGIPEFSDMAWTSNGRIESSTSRPDYLGIPRPPAAEPSRAERRATLLQYAEAYEAVAVKMRRQADRLDDSPAAQTPEYLAYLAGELPDPRD